MIYRVRIIERVGNLSPMGRKKPIEFSQLIKLLRRVMSSSIITPVGGAITRATLHEYVTVLEQIQTIYNSIKASAATADTQTLLSQARILAALNEELNQMEAMGLVSAPILQNLALAISAKLQPLTNAVYSTSGANVTSLATAFGNDSSVGTLLQNALNPNNWSQVSGLTGLGNFHILDAPQDYAFYELYRTVEAGMNNTVGLYGNALQSADELLQALNLINTGPTWNPGSDYISTQGTLQDLADGTSWFTKYQTDGIDDNMLQGLQMLYQIQQGGYYPAGSSEGALVNNIITKLASDLPNGYDKAVSEDGALAMWNDTAFRVQLQNGVELVTQINDTAQDQMQRVLLIYQEVTEAMIKINARLSENIKKTAKKLGPRG